MPRASDEYQDMTVEEMFLRNKNLRVAGKKWEWRFCEWEDCSVVLWTYFSNNQKYCWDCRPKAISRSVSEFLVGHDTSVETRRRMSISRKGVKKGRPAVGFYVDAEGYRVLTMQYDHLLSRDGNLEEHRKVLWEKLGCEDINCGHKCNWCGKVLDWVNRGSQNFSGIQADHLDSIASNNSPENLVVSCLGCNLTRRWK